MSYTQIDGSNCSFWKYLELTHLLLAIRPHVQNISWSLHHPLWACGDIVPVLGMTILELEKKCSAAQNGVRLSFRELVDLGFACDDIIDITVVGCADENAFPKAHREDHWQDRCDVIIIRHDSTLWELYAKKREIMQVFESFRDVTEQNYEKRT